MNPLPLGTHVTNLCTVVIETFSQNLLKFFIEPGNIFPPDNANSFFTKLNPRINIPARDFLRKTHKPFFRSLKQAQHSKQSTQD